MGSSLGDGSLGSSLGDGSGDGLSDSESDGLGDGSGMSCDGMGLGEGDAVCVLAEPEFMPVSTPDGFLGPAGAWELFWVAGPPGLTGWSLPWTAGGITAAGLSSGTTGVLEGLPRRAAEAAAAAGSVICSADSDELAPCSDSEAELRIWVLTMAPAPAAASTAAMERAAAGRNAAICCHLSVAPIGLVRSLHLPVSGDTQVSASHVMPETRPWTARNVKELANSTRFQPNTRASVLTLARLGRAQWPHACAAR